MSRLQMHRQEIKVMQLCDGHMISSDIKKHFHLIRGASISSTDDCERIPAFEHHIFDRVTVNNRSETRLNRWFSCV